MISRAEEPRPEIQRIERGRPWTRDTHDPWQPLILLDTSFLKLPSLGNGRYKCLVHLNTQLPFSLLLLKLPPHLLGRRTIAEHRPPSHSHTFGSIDTPLMGISRSAVLCEPRSMVLVPWRGFDNVVEVDRRALVADVACLLC